MEQQFKQIIDQAGSIVILLPRGPYFDQVAAGLALYLTLRDKKNVEIHAPTPMLVEFNRLVGVNKISTELGNKNLLVSFADYNAENIERVKYDIENKQFKLTVIPKPQATPPNKDQVIQSSLVVQMTVIFQPLQVLIWQPQNLYILELVTYLFQAADK